MIDLHCHILPGIDDGASDLNVSLAMATALAESGVSVVACTPHILPGIYHNTGPQIRDAVSRLQQHISEAGIPLHLVTGADVHIAPGLVAGLKQGNVLALADTRYVLIEPPHHIAPLRMEDVFFELLVAGYVPILTHPERLTWITSHYQTIKKLVSAGVWMQITAGSLIGAFGRQPLYWSERMLDEGLVHILASDAHDVSRRPPLLAKGRDAAARRLGMEEAVHLVSTRPRGIISNAAPASLPLPGAHAAARGSTGDYDERQSRSARNAPRHAGESGAADARGGLHRLSHRLRRLFH